MKEISYKNLHSINDECKHLTEDERIEIDIVLDLIFDTENTVLEYDEFQWAVKQMKVGKEVYKRFMDFMRYAKPILKCR